MRACPRPLESERWRADVKPALVDRRMFSRALPISKLKPFSTRHTTCMYKTQGNTPLWWSPGSDGLLLQKEAAARCRWDVPHILYIRWLGFTIHIRCCTVRMCFRWTWPWADGTPGGPVVPSRLPTRSASRFHVVEARSITVRRVAPSPAGSLSLWYIFTRSKHQRCTVYCPSLEQQLAPKSNHSSM